MNSKRKLTIWTVSFLAFFLLNFGCQEEVGAGPLAPDFTLKDLSGNMRTLSRYRGQVVIVDFWATWCPPCRMFIPELVKLQEKYRDKGLIILAISIDDPQRASDKYVQAFSKKFKINYTILRYNYKAIQDYFGNTSPSVPTIFVIDKEGKIRDKVVGYRPGVLEKSLVGLLK